jgi:hypothetical protein
VGFGALGGFRITSSVYVMFINNINGVDEMQERLEIKIVSKMN